MELNYTKTGNFSVIKWNARKRSDEERHALANRVGFANDTTLGEFDFDGTLFRPSGVLGTVFGPVYVLNNAIPGILVFGEHRHLPYDKRTVLSCIQLLDPCAPMQASFLKGRDQFACEYC